MKVFFGSKHAVSAIASIALCFIVISIGCALVDNGNISNSSEVKITVETVEGFIRALGSDRTIELAPGEYNLSMAVKKPGEEAMWEEVFDGEEIHLLDIKNLNITGLGEKPVRILVEPRYANVLTFIRGSNITISNIEAGHTPEKGFCAGGVFVFDNASNIKLNDCVLFGCGMEGLTLRKTENFVFRNSVIKECTYGIMTLYGCKNIVFTGSSFLNNEQFTMINIISCARVVFDECELNGNKSGNFESMLFSAKTCENVVVKNSRITNNTANYLMNTEGALIFQETKFEGNSFSGGRCPKD